MSTQEWQKATCGKRSSCFVPESERNGQQVCPTRQKHGRNCETWSSQSHSSPTQRIIDGLIHSSITQESLKGSYYDPSEQQRGVKRPNRRSSLNARALSLSHKRSKLDFNDTRNVSPVSSEPPVVPISTSCTTSGLQIQTGETSARSMPPPSTVVSITPTQPRNFSASYQSPTADPRIAGPSQQLSPRTRPQPLLGQRSTPLTESPVTSPKINSSTRLPDSRSRTPSSESYLGAMRANSAPVPTQPTPLLPVQPSRTNSDINNRPDRQGGPSTSGISHSLNSTPAATPSGEVPPASKASLASTSNGVEGAGTAPLPLKRSIAPTNVPGSTTSDNLFKILPTK